MVLEACAGADPGADEVLAAALRALAEAGLDVRTVRPLREGHRAFALHARFDTLLREAERVKLFKRLKRSSPAGATQYAQFVRSNLSEFDLADQPDRLFSSGERIMLVEALLMDLPAVEVALGIHDPLATSSSSSNANNMSHGLGAESDKDHEGKGGRPASAIAAEQRGEEEDAAGPPSLRDVLKGRFRKRDGPRIVRIIPLHYAPEARELELAWVRSVGFQPLDRIAKYFGQQYGFYFAFLGEYTMWLVPPAAAGVWLWREQRARQDEPLENMQTLGFALAMALWATSFLERWKRRQSALAFEWHSVGFEDAEEQDRPEFRERAKPVFCEAVGAYRWRYPGWRRVLAYLISFFGCLLLSVLAGVTMLFFLFLSSIAKKEWHGPEFTGLWMYAQYVPTGLYLASISAFSYVSQVSATVLTKLENHRTRSDHRNALIVKLVALRFCNYFVMLFYVAFIEQDLTELRHNVAALLGLYQVLGQLGELATPLLVAFRTSVSAKSTPAALAAAKGTKATAASTSAPAQDASNGDRNSNSLLAAAAADPPLSHANGQASDSFPGHENCETNVSCEEPTGVLADDEAAVVVGAPDAMLADAEEDVFSDFLELWVQFGQVTLFSMVFPLAPLLALLNNIMEIRLDAFKVLRMQKRCIPRRASSIGSWLTMFEVLGYIAVMTNVALIGVVFNQSELGSRWLVGWSNSARILLLVFVEHIIVALKFVISKAVPELSEEVAFIKRVRHQSEQRELYEEFELRSAFQDMLSKQRNSFASDAEHAKYLVKDTAGSSDRLLRWALQQDHRRRKAERHARAYAAHLDRLQASGSQAASFSDLTQFLNIALAFAAFVLLFSREAREATNAASA